MNKPLLPLLARSLLGLWLVVAGSAGSPTPCAANTAVTLQPEVEIKRYAVKLSDLFIGVPAEIDRDIAQAPPPCKPVVYDQQVLNKLADTYRLDWQPQGSSDHAVVTSSCARITNDMIRDAVVARLKQDGVAKERSFEITFDTRALEVDLPADQSPDFTLNNFAYDPASKHFRADLTAKTERGPYVLPITGHVAVKRSVPILAHRLEAGTTISENDLDWMQMPEERITADIISEASQLVGRELRRDTGEGEMLHSHDVTAPRLVLRGSLVTMKIETPFITVTAQGKSQQDGAQGDTVRVLNTQSNRVIEGVVTGPGIIEIHTAQKLASVE
jgi:flagella basal body P-ring formation protein FlgA